MVLCRQVFELVDVASQILILDDALQSALLDVEGRVDVTVAEDDTEVQIVTYRWDKPIRTRHLEIAAAPHAPIPDWHLGRGNDRWMFLDEIRLEIQSP